MTKDEILEKARKEYPTGTVFKSAGDVFFIPSKGGQEFTVDLPLEWYANDVGITHPGIGYVYYQGEWAEIISSPNPTFKKGDYITVTGKGKLKGKIIITRYDEEYRQNGKDPIRAKGPMISDFDCELSIGQFKYFEFSGFCYIADDRISRFSTQEEINWLNKCIASGKLEEKSACLRVTDLVKDLYYRYYYDDSKYVIAKCKNSATYDAIGLWDESTGWEETGNFSKDASFSMMSYAIPATTEDIVWIDACIRASKYLPNPSLYTIGIDPYIDIQAEQHFKDVQLTKERTSPKQPFSTEVILPDLVQKQTIIYF